MSANTVLHEIDLRGPPLDGLPFAIDDMSVAFHLGFKAQTLWWLILNPEQAYDVFTIPKASGGVRTIHAPGPAMKLLLRNLRRKYLLPQVTKLGDEVTAYRPGRSILDAVKQHIRSCPVCDTYDVPHTCDPVTVVVGDQYCTNKKPCRACEQPPKHTECPRRGVKIHLDLTEFFGNTRVSWIRDYLTEEAGYNRQASKVLAAAMTVESDVKHGNNTVRIRGAPQGAPTSGDICNLVAAQRLDQNIQKSLVGRGWAYTRYADDLYLSHSKSLPDEEVQSVIETIVTAIEKAGWRNNRKKLEIQRPRRTQRLLGITINRKPNIPAQQYARFRCIVHRCWRDGLDVEARRHRKSVGQLLTWLRGVFNWFGSINNAKAQRLGRLLDLAKEKYDAGQ